MTPDSASLALTVGAARSPSAPLPVPCMYAACRHGWRDNRGRTCRLVHMVEAVEELGLGHAASQAEAQALLKALLPHVKYSRMPGLQPRQVHRHGQPGTALGQQPEQRGLLCLYSSTQLCMEVQDSASAAVQCRSRAQRLM